MGNYFIKASVKNNLLTIDVIDNIDCSDSLFKFFYGHLDCRRVDNVGLGQNGDDRLIFDDEVMDNKCETAIFHLFDECSRMPFEVVGNLILCTTDYLNGEPCLTGYKTKEDAFSAFKEFVWIESVSQIDTETQLKIKDIDISYYNFLINCQ
ncbi:hypothetical protein [Rummeliibacillus pycnus]|uniref:hypothetical protein n=1 Tax=Rummeliibacillus pycnus TaxID=101070 RepID=UPI003D28E917